MSFIAGTTSMVAAPAMTSMYAPGMTSMYTGAPASMYAPASVIQAAPVTTMAAAPVVTARAPSVVPAAVQGASFVAPPVAVAAPVAAESFVVPQFTMPAPVSLTQGLPTPDKLAGEQAAYLKALDAQLEKQSKAVLQEADIKKKMLEQAKQTQIAEFSLQAEEQCKMACFQVDREAQTMVNGLKEAAILQRTSVEERAAIAAAEYNKMKALEEMSQKSYALQKQWYEGEAKFTYDYQKVMQAGSRAIAPGYGMEHIAPVPTYQGAVAAVPTATIPTTTVAAPYTTMALGTSTIV